MSKVRPKETSHAGGSNRTVRAPEARAAVMVLAVSAAFTSAAGFAVSTSLQHRAAHALATSQVTASQLLRRLLAQPLWVLGILVGALAFGFHAFAVSQGALALVQPIVVSGMVMAVPVRAFLEHRRPSAHELRWAGVTAAGLAVFIVAANPTAGHIAARGAISGLLLTAGAAAALGLRATATRAATGHSRGVILGLSAGIVFGLLAGLMKSSVQTLTATGVMGLAGSWPFWTMIAVGISGVSLNQRAYQAAPLSASMPVLNVVAVLVALVFGLCVFGETPAHGPAALLGEVAGLVALSVGLRHLFQHSPTESPEMVAMGHPSQPVAASVETR
jgi:drug/metabolite transporter (DMT)-like permease